MPAGAFLVPFALAAGLNSSGTVTIVLPQWLLVIAFTLLGWNIGLGFTRAILMHARRALLPTVASIIVLIGFSGLLAGLLILVLGIDPLTAYLATSPGGLDSIAVIAASSNVAAVRLLRDVGDDKVIAMARDLGVTAPLEKGDPSLALGFGDKLTHRLEAGAVVSR